MMPNEVIAALSRLTDLEVGAVAASALGSDYVKPTPGKVRIFLDSLTVAELADTEVDAALARFPERGRLAEAGAADHLRQTMRDLAKLGAHVRRQLPRETDAALNDWREFARSLSDVSNSASLDDTALRTRLYAEIDEATTLARILRADLTAARRRADAAEAAAFAAPGATRPLVAGCRVRIISHEVTRFVGQTGTLTRVIEGRANVLIDDPTVVGYQIDLLLRDVRHESLTTASQGAT